METNGIIRRIDDLGRIVIPREFRRLYGIDIGDPMEINATNDGEIIVKKADTSKEMQKVAKKVAGAAADELSGTILACDFNSWLVAYGPRRGEFSGKSIAPKAAKLIRARETFTDGDGELLGISDGDAHTAVFPAAADGDCFGGVGYISDSAITKEELAILRIAARVIGELMKKF